MVLELPKLFAQLLGGYVRGILYSRGQSQRSAGNNHFGRMHPQKLLDDGIRQLVVFSTANAMYEGLKRIDWSQHLSVNGTLVVDFQGTSSGVKHTQFGALKTKDAIVDQFRDKFGERPSVDTEKPDVRINVHAHREQATVSIDLSGDSLHRRGYRARGVAAPLKENLAAAILLRSGWPALAASGATLIDPMCGSGTLVIEAALMACDIAPGWLRTHSAHWGMVNWGGHDAALWQRLLDEVSERAAAGKQGRVVLRGYDHDASAVHASPTA